MDERLEEIKRKLDHAEEQFEHHATYLTIQDIEHLIQEAEQKQQLEKDIETYRQAISSWEVIESYNRKDSQRYRRALEYYAFESGYSDDGGQKAREALEVSE